MKHPLLSQSPKELTNQPPAQKSRCEHADVSLVLTFISDGDPCVGAKAIRGKLHKEMSGGADDPLVRQVFHLIRVVQDGRVDVVPIFNEEPVDVNST